MDIFAILTKENRNEDFMGKQHEQLEKTFNLPSLDELTDDAQDDIEVDDEEYDWEEPEEELTEEELKERLDGMNKKLSEYKDKESSDGMPIKNTEKYNKDVDELFTTAKDGYEEIFNAALTMEPAHGAKFLSGAAKLLEIALKSKNSIMEKQLEMAKLQLEREKMMANTGKKPPQDIDPETEEEEEGVDGFYGYGENGGKVFDRNALLEKIKNKNSNNKDDE